MADDTLIFDTRLDTSGLSTGLGKIGNIAGTAFKGVAVAVGAATTAVGVLAKSALDGYANYEQLVGGVETLFKGSSDVVMEYARNAYQTAGLSANEYMETVTSFSASLIQSLDGDTAEAARVADVAITDMSDNANKMGTSMESIQDAYQGFAKQNYTMLDNLKLGYGGTKTEMERLLSDAEKLPTAMGRDFDISNYADVVEAIHLVQENMGIAGTTALEASETISGSVSAMKSAWGNLVVGIADDNADLDLLIDQFISSLVTAGDNILPRIETILMGIGTLVETMLPKIIDMLPNMLTNILPQLITSGVNMVNSIIGGITNNLPILLKTILSLVTQIVDVITTNLPMVIKAGLQVVVQLAQGIADALPKLIPTIVDTMLLIVDTLIENIDMLVDSAIAIIIALANGLINALPNLINRVPEIISKLVSALITNAPKLLTAGLELILTLARGLVESVPNLLSKVPQIIDDLVKKFKSALSGVANIGKSIVEGIWDGISSGWQWLTNKVGEIASGLFNTAKKVLGIHSPSTKFKYIGEMCVAGFNEGISDLMTDDTLTKSINASVRTVSDNTSAQAYTSKGGFSQVINVNREISTPDELARAVRLESKYGLMGGVKFV